jgi:hypothetical protein
MDVLWVFIRCRFKENIHLNGTTPPCMAVIQRVAADEGSSGDASWDRASRAFRRHDVSQLRWYIRRPWGRLPS